MSEKKIKSVSDLSALRDSLRKEIDIRAGQKEIRVTVHMGTCGIAAGARDVLSALATELAAVSAENVTLKQSGCAGFCDQEPMITLSDSKGNEARYGKLDAQKAREIVRRHVVDGSPAVEFLIKT